MEKLIVTETEKIYTCDLCGEQQTDPLTEVNNDGIYYCDECICDHTIVCDCCNHIYTEEYMHAVNDGDFSYCDECVNNECFNCHRCGEIYLTDNAYRLVVDHCDTTEMYCESCDDYVGAYCDQCEERFDSTLIETHCDNEAILRYDYVPIWLYHRTENVTCERENINRYFAMELEVEIDNNHNPYDVAEMINDDFTFCKNDGSLQHGFEIVTHPMSWNFLTENVDMINDKLEILKSNGANSHNTKTCGIHIHFSRWGLTDYNIYKFQKFCYSNLPLLQIVSQRERHTNNCQWSIDNEPLTVNSERMNITRDATKYTAINLAHNNSIEVRIFRGNLLIERVMKNFEFVKSLIDLVKYSLLTDLSLDDYFRFIDAYADRYPNLIKFLDDKRDSIRNFVF